MSDSAGPGPGRPISPTAGFPAASAVLAPEGPAHAATINSSNLGNSFIQSSSPSSFLDQEQQSRVASLPLGLAGRVRSMRYQLQERPAHDEDILNSLQPISTSEVAEEYESSEAESDSFAEWAPGSPDLRTGLLQHSRHAGHKQRQQHSRLAGRQAQPQQEPKHSSIFGAVLLAGLFRSKGSQSAGHQQQQDSADAAAATADLLESGGSLTFEAHASMSHARQQGSAAATSAATAAATVGTPTADMARNGVPDTAEDAGDPAGRCFSAPTGMPQSEASVARSGQLNEEVFTGGLVGASTSGLSHGARSMTQPQLSKGKRRWQGAAQKVIAMHQITSTFRPGALQGIDVKRHSYDSLFGALHTEVNVTVVDYNKDQVEVATDITNAMLPEVLKVARPEWSKVRWINVQGLSWDVITALAVAFDLHPLSVEDIVHIPQRIKADYYPEYLYASVILLSVDHPSQLGSQKHPTAAAAGASSSKQPPLRHSGSTAAGARLNPRLSDSGSSVVGASGADGVPFGGTMSRVLRTRLFGAAGAKRRQYEKQVAAVGCPAELQPMQPTVEQASIFLFRDGTLITMFQSVGNDTIARRLMSKLEGFRSLLTDSQDASYLFNAVLDAVVDHTLPLVQVYSSRIAALESRVLLDSRPQASLTKELHLLSNDLKLLRRTLVPTQHLVHKLQNTHDKDNNQGFLSPLTVLYLSDVYDHISTVVEDMISLAEDAKDLIDLIFNTIAHNNNSSMQMLAVVSAIFLPITFLAGVYGTNFDQWFPEIHWQYGYVYFWVACVAITAGFSGLLQRWGMFETEHSTVMPPYSA